MLHLRTGLVLGVLTVLTACTFARLELEKTEAELFPKPKPEFPQSERVRGREGWVMLGYAVDRGGLVSDVGVVDSSGRKAFEAAALDAIRQWRYVPGEEQQLTVLVNFVYERKQVQLSRRFVNLNDTVHEHIDDGDLAAAESLLADIRGDDDLTAFELAYSFLTEGRIASKYGDRSKQLSAFRKAMLNEGRWLARENYLSCLRAAIALEIEQGDYASALRDYDLLTETDTGRALAADLESSIQTIKSWIEGMSLETQPFVVADSSVSVVRERSGSTASIVRGPGPDDRATTPRPSPPPTRRQ